MSNPRDLPADSGLSTPLGKPIPRSEPQKPTLVNVPDRPHLKQDQQGRWQTNIPTPQKGNP